MEKPAASIGVEAAGWLESHAAYIICNFPSNHIIHRMVPKHK
jgi:hypothetical protein